MKIPTCAVAGPLLTSLSYYQGKHYLVLNIASLCEFFIDPNLSITLQIVRVIFRPLKILSSMEGKPSNLNDCPEVRKLLDSLFRSFPDFANVGIFLVFNFLLFSAWGVQEYSGMVYNTCRITAAPDNGTWPSDLSFNRPCSLQGDGNFVCPADMVCGNIEDYPEITL